MCQKEKDGIEWIDALDEINLNLQRSDGERNSGRIITGNVLSAMETEQVHVTACQSYHSGTAGECLAVLYR